MLAEATAEATGALGDPYESAADEAGALGDP